MGQSIPASHQERPLNIIGMPCSISDSNDFKIFAFLLLFFISPDFPMKALFFHLLHRSTMQASTSNKLTRLLTEKWTRSFSDFNPIGIKLPQPPFLDCDLLYKAFLWHSSHATLHSYSQCFFKHVLESEIDLKPFCPKCLHVLGR